MIVDTLVRLRGHGYYPDGFKPNGDIRWATVLKGLVQIEMEKGLPALQGKSIEELQAIARRGYRKVVKKVSVSKAESHEVNFEREYAL